MAPDDWNFEALEALRGAFYEAAPLKTTPLEANTMPSWLWNRRSCGTQTSPETSIHQVARRVAGSATFSGWHKGAFERESDALSFCKSVERLLSTRALALEPKALNNLGIDWAYGVVKTALAGHGEAAEPMQQSVQRKTPVTKTAVTNAMIDSVVSHGISDAKAQWQKLLRTRADALSLSLRFEDTEREWNVSGADSSHAPRLVLDLMKFLGDDGAFDVNALQQAVRHAVLLLELHFDSLVRKDDPARALAIGFVNLAGVLLGLGLPYDSVEGRATATAIAGMITGTAVHASAELAAKFSPCSAFEERRESVMRSLRNHHRAMYGERNDYERLSIVPAALDVESGADLVLVAAARRAWDEATESAKRHGLRHLQLTELFSVPVFTPYLDCTSQGVEPEVRFVRQNSSDGYVFRRELSRVAKKALLIAKCDPSDIAAVERYACGYATLRAAPGINHSVLREKGFDDAALERLEGYLPHVGHIRQAFTAWVLGEKFCRHALGIEDRDLLDPRFDLLKRLGFTELETTLANAFCCGRGTITGATELPAALRACLTSQELSPDAVIRMAGAVQSAVMGDVDMTAFIPASTSIEDRENLLLLAWMQGLRRVTLRFEGTIVQGRRAADRARAFVKSGLARVRSVRPPEPTYAASRVSLRMRTPERLSKPLAPRKAKASVHDVSVKTPASRHVPHYRGK